MKLYPRSFHQDPFFKEVCFHLFRSVVFLHLGGKRHGCHFIVLNGSAQWFAGAHSWRSLLSPSVVTEAFSLLNGSTNHFVYMLFILFASIYVCVSTMMHFYTGSHSLMSQFGCIFTRDPIA